MSLKALIASDLHGDLEALKAYASIVETELPDMIFLLGDYFGRSDDIEVSRILNRYANRTVGVIGNCDAEEQLKLLQFKTFDKKDVFFQGHCLHLLHGHDIYALEDVKLGKGDCLILGHSHRLNLEKRAGIWYLNPGSLTKNRLDDPTPTYMIMTSEDIRLYQIDGRLIGLKDFK